MEIEKKIDKKMIYIFIFALIIFFEPQMFKENAFVGVEKVDNIYKILKLLIAGAIFLEYIKINKFKISKLLICVSIPQFIMFISTIFNNGDIMRFMGPAITVIVMTMIAEILIERKILITVLKRLNIYFGICFIINIISVLLIDFTEVGKYVKVYFLGIDNRFIFTLLPWILFEGIVSIHEENKLNRRWKVVVILSELLLLYKFSVSAMICLSLYLILFVSILSNKKMAKFNIGYFVTYILSNIFIVFELLKNVIKPIINLLGKDITFAGRTYLWEGVINQFYKCPLIGQGMQSINYDKNFFYNSTRPYYLEFCKVSHAHNSLMTMLYRGGIISVIFYLLIIFEALRQLKNNVNNKYSNLLLITLGIILITSIFDTMDFAGLYFTLTIIINIKKLNNEMEN